MKNNKLELLIGWTVVGVGLSALAYSTISAKFYNDREICIEKIVRKVDVNHDGYDDLVALNGNGKIKIFYGNSRGGYDFNPVRK